MNQPTTNKTQSTGETISKSAASHSATTAAADYAKHRDDEKIYGPACTALTSTSVHKICRSYRIFKAFAELQNSQSKIF
eukprot:scaffold24060_cov50-Attheya_sp.AAC.8